MPRPTPADFDRVDRKVMEDIEKHGWSDIAVFPVEGEENIPHVHFNYTVGLTERYHPELLMVGLPNEVMHMVLQSVYAQVVDGATFRPDTYSDLILEGLPVAFVEVLDMDNEQVMMSMARRIYGDRARGLQVVWPDPQGRFPWHPDFEEIYRDRQLLAGPWKGPM